MPSFDAINYSLRPSKAIQRQLVFQGIRELYSQLRLSDSVYVGLGSVWFTDFVLAHEILNIKDMVSIEENEIGFARAQFNAPYATVQVRQGSSTDTLPALLSDGEINQRPWVVWLDYDGEFDERLKDDVKLIIENVPSNTTFMITFNAHEMNYGAANERPERIQQLFGDVVPDNLSKNSCKTPRLQDKLAGFAIDFMRSVAAGGRRQGAFVDTVQIVYQDGSPMITVGGMLSAPGTVEAIRNAASNLRWRCRPEEVIRAPHLTIREALALQAMLPSAESLTREKVQEAGFDLKEEQILVYQEYYREYPNFAEVRT